MLPLIEQIKLLISILGHCYQRLIFPSFSFSIKVARRSNFSLQQGVSFLVNAKRIEKKLPSLLFDNCSRYNKRER
jgi:hypothetical protein